MTNNHKAEFASHPSLAPQRTKSLMYSPFFHPIHMQCVITFQFSMLSDEINKNKEAHIVNHRIIKIIEWFGLEGTLKIMKLQPAPPFPPPRG